ncbi:glutamate N-acetyltransferase [Clostridium acidisoli DSM 12555]|uniref:Arginine biosynthesis bifunctional protein ArgJ n=1 Tax=Clostridium acidisoli DSM 12555 TaxID=1121291 RepID=A0A1W1XAB4_9CLOT|nr:bifunctional ornithine acetyltransferase/N-acetylglutamate synthase [Clostridium acidisoli]SMC20777.1 glutamate N-acetyltransferase [Clostridium acidisoli DSM 12555]
MKSIKILENKTITDVPFFKASGIHCGLKKSKKDLCVIYSERKAVAAAAFTRNIVKAAPVLLNMKTIDNNNIQAIVANSGNANACTGDKGYKDAELMAELTAQELNLSSSEVLVASTGVIGEPLPFDKIKTGIKLACDSLSYEGGEDAGKAIMTTDTFLKKLTIEFEIDGKKSMISAIAKGSGMIHPNMGTMLSFIATDANISKSMLNKSLKESVEDSYNMVSVDGDTSTNDMVIVLANGACENELIDSESKNYEAFKTALHFLNIELSKMIAKDGEGATKLLEVIVNHSKTLEDAKICSKAVITSSLVKAAFFGADANWGRILCALGYSGANLNVDAINIFFSNQIGTIQICKNGGNIGFDETLAKNILEEEKITITIDLNDGEYSATAWGCDLTYDYVKINGSYRS